MKNSAAFVFAVLALFASPKTWATGDAGCGLGSMIFTSNAKGTQLFAITTNWSFFSQPFGITSGTSGCSSHGLVDNRTSLEYFVAAHRDELSREISQGSGEVLSTVAAMLAQKNAGQFGQLAQSRFTEIYPNFAVSNSAVAAKLIEIAQLNEAIKGT